MKKTILLISLISLPLLGCDNSLISSSSLSNQESSNENNEYEAHEFYDIDDIIIDVNEIIETSNVIRNTNVYDIKVSNENIAVFENNCIVGKNIGETTLTITRGSKRQEVKITVQSSYADPLYKFSNEDLSGKNLVVFGDSVSAVATINNSKATYSYLFASNYKMNLVNNYAIGGTTATYMYQGSNIYKEYASNSEAIDGCRVVNKAYLNNELNNIDYAFIAFGHNDQYFQPPISVLNDRRYCDDDTFSTCRSYKSSYRYMINVLRKANPNVKIILLNCTYSEYDKNLPSPYGSKYSYLDYRLATTQIAAEMNCKLIDPWNYMEPYFDFNKGFTYYKDSVHITEKGHKLLADYIINQ